VERVLLDMATEKIQEIRVSSEGVFEELLEGIASGGQA